MNALNQTWHVVRGGLMKLDVCLLSSSLASDSSFLFAGACWWLIRPLLFADSCSLLSQEHFVCTDCGCAFPDMVFFEKDGKPYCQNDYAKRFCEK